MSETMTAIRETGGEIALGPSCRLTYHLRYPFLPEQPSISRCYLQYVRLYEQRIHTRYLPDLQRMPGGSLAGDLTIEGSCEIMYAQNGLFSAFMDIYEDLGPYRRTLGRSSATWDLRSARQLGLAQLFRSPNAVRRIISGRIGLELAGGREGCYYPAPPARQPRQFYLSEGGLAVYFQPDTVAPASGGIPTFLIPWDDLRPYAKFPL